MQPASANHLQLCWQSQKVLTACMEDPARTAELLSKLQEVCQEARWGRGC